MREENLTRTVFEYICDHPGCTRKDILTVLPRDVEPNMISNLLGRLQRMGAIKNPGGFAQYACWYPTIEVPADPKYRQIARDLMLEMKTVHHVMREAYLAKRLQELFGTTS